MNFSYQVKGIFVIFRYLLPFSIRLRIRRIHQAYVFKKAFKLFQLHYHELDKFPNLLNDLIYGWGNMGWSTFQDYSRAVIENSLSINGTILECGSGLSTVLMGVIAEDKGQKIYSLEHHPQWAEFTRKRLADLSITSATVIEAPLVAYQGYDWYDFSKLPLISSIELVVCDGPPHDTRGGRYGLIPVMRDYFTKATIILLDDYGREEEQKIVDDWRKVIALSVKSMGRNDQFAYITLVSE